jgi:hypothetical protein
MSSVRAEPKEWSPFAGVVYGVLEMGSAEVRYIGLTTKTIRRRRSEHFKNADRGIKTPFADWLRTYQSREDVWSDEQRRAVGDRTRGTTHPNPLRGPDDPMWGRTHTDEQKAIWSEARKGTNAGATNPNFGKFGPAHPSYGHTMSPESRARLSEMRRGENNANFGKSASEETRAKMSAVRKGRPMPSSVRSAHTRHHTNKGVFTETCRHCIDDQHRAESGENES